MGKRRMGTKYDPVEFFSWTIILSPIKSPCVEAMWRGCRSMDLPGGRSMRRGSSERENAVITQGRCVHVNLRTHKAPDAVAAYSLADKLGQKLSRVRTWLCDVGERFADGSITNHVLGLHFKIVPEMGGAGKKKRALQCTVLFFVFFSSAAIKLRFWLCCWGRIKVKKMLMIKPDDWARCSAADLGDVCFLSWWNWRMQRRDYVALVEKNSGWKI